MLKFLVKRKKSSMVISAATLIAVLGLSLPALAGPVLTVPIGSGGVVRHENRGNHRRIFGSGIRLGELAFGADILRLFRGRLSFSGGSFLGSKQGNLFWGSGGHLSINGCADLNHDSKCDKGDFRGTLMTASFLNLKLIDRNGQEILEAKIIEHLSPQLAALLKLSNTTQTGELELTLASLSNGKWWERDSVVSGSLGSQAVPESASFWLLGASVAFLAGMRHRRTRTSG